MVKMFVNNIDPTIFSIGIFEIRYYGLVYALGFILLFFWLKKKKEILKIKNVDEIILYLFIGMMVGARILHFFFENVSVFVNNPLEILKIWHGGMSFFGGLLGSTAAVYIYCRKNRISFLRLGDIVAVPVSLIMFFGRIANFLNSELVGKASNLNFCVVFQKVDNICRHPYQIYAALSMLLLFFILLYARKLKDEKGFVFFNFLFFYGILRFSTDFFRVDAAYLGLSVWQWMSLVLSLSTCVFYIIYKQKNDNDKNMKKIKKK